MSIYIISSNKYKYNCICNSMHLHFEPVTGRGVEEIPTLCSADTTSWPLNEYGRPFSDKHHQM